MSGRTPLRLTGCTTCRASILRSFISGTAPLVSIRASSHPSSILAPAAKQYRFSSTLDSRPIPEDETGATSAISSNGTSEERDAEGGKQDVNNSDVPWYLQEEPPRHPTLMHEPAPIPELPHDPPRLLEPLLKCVAEDLGLDDLNLLDLRSLDPPPALGPNLLMLFGTARSERHLHVSAGNLVRWLRTKGIHANADGLLGPNELKIRLRRKARKAKLLGNSGLTPSEDDGISTRWICVNLGTIGWTSAEAELQSDDGRFSGFGAPRTGTTIVVQLFTDAKRKELDLETLWDRILQRQARADSGNAGPDIQKPSSPLQVPGPRTTHPFSRPGQQRVLSTYAPRRAGLSDFTDRTDQVIQTPLRKPGLRIVDDVLALSPSGKFGALEKLRTHFVQLPEPLAHEALRFRDAPSGFMQAWNKVVSSLPSDRTWRFRLWLYSTGRKMGHLDYNLSGLRGLVREMQLSCIQPGQDHYLVLLQAIYTEPGGSDDLLKAQSELAVELLDTMYERGDAVITADILVTVMESLARSGVSGPEMERLQSVLDKLIVQAKLPYLGETLLMRLMDAYAFQGNWDRFWEVWRIPPRFQMARSPVMYTYVYRRLADTGHQSRCVHAVRSCFWEMLAEDPPVVPQDELLEALRACIKVADPEAISLDWRLLNTWDMDKEDKGKLRRREFVKLAKALRKMERRRGYAEGTA